MTSQESGDEGGSVVVDDGGCFPRIVEGVALRQVDGVGAEAVLGPADVREG